MSYKCSDQECKPSPLIKKSQFSAFRKSNFDRFTFSSLPVVGSAFFVPGLVNQNIELSFNTVSILLAGLLVAWATTFIVFLSRSNRQKRRYIKVLETHLKEKEEATQALVRSERKYQDLINRMNEGLILTNGNGIIRFANARACSILNYHPEKLMNKALRNFVFGEEEVLNYLNHDDKHFPSSHHKEVQMVKGDNKMIWARLSISYQGMAAGERPGAVIVLSDITEKKEAENELHNLTIDLNQKIKQLDCLFDISDILGAPGISFDGIFERCLQIIPNGLKYSHDVCTEISFDEKRYASANFTKTPWSYTVPIRSQKKKLGHITVGYVEEKPKIRRDPFHINEKILLKNIAEKLGQIIEYRKILQTAHS